MPACSVRLASFRKLIGRGATAWPPDINQRPRRFGRRLASHQQEPEGWRGVQLHRLLRRIDRPEVTTTEAYLGFELTGQFFCGLPVARLRRMADLCAVEENSANPFGTVAAPPMSITGMCAFDQVASVNAEHFAASFRISELAPSVEEKQNSRKSASRKGDFWCRKEGRLVQKKRVSGTVGSIRSRACR